MFKGYMKKIFVVTGELSGDRLAAWYIQKRRQQEQNLIVHAVGGDALHASGALLYQRFETLNVVGVLEIIAHLPTIFRMLADLAHHIVSHEYDEVVVVDFPGFNLRLIKKLKRIKPSLTIIYVSPPQLWCWGSWRVKTLKKYTDQVIVMYPFEVGWYQQRGVTVEWVGSPVYDALAQYRIDSNLKKHCIALIPGSRRSEIETLLPLFLRVAQTLKQEYPVVNFVFPLAQSIKQDFVESIILKNGLTDIWKKVEVVRDDQQKYSTLSWCCAALCKPGTVTLELAVLQVPTVIAFKTSWITYLLARLVVTVEYMGLPNLLLGRSVCSEFIQQDCTHGALVASLGDIYASFACGDQLYKKRLQDFDDVVRAITR
jgi:lipid-A-disaccharide synthase